MSIEKQLSEFLEIAISMKAWTIDAADYSLYRADEKDRKKQDNKDFQETIERTFRQPDSAKIFNFLAQYGSLTLDQLAALFKQMQLLLPHHVFLLQQEKLTLVFGGGHQHILIHGLLGKVQQI